MTQSINFDDIKSAFAPTPQIANVTSIDNNESSQLTHDFRGSNTKSKVSNFTLTKDSSLNSDKQMVALNDEKLALQDSLDTMEQAYQKSLRFIKTITLEKTQSDGQYQSVHDDKIRLIRIMKTKQEEIEELKKNLVTSSNLERKLNTMLKHAKKDLVKSSNKRSKMASEINSLKSLIKGMTQEVSELKEKNSLRSKLKESISSKFFEGKSKFNSIVEHIKAATSRPNTYTPKINWSSVSNSLPNTQSIVLVRNRDDESDIASFNPETGRFKCSHKQISIIEWAPMN